MAKHDLQPKTGSIKHIAGILTTMICTLEPLQAIPGCLHHVSTLPDMFHSLLMHV
jgi:hypothetical protein